MKKQFSSKGQVPNKPPGHQLVYIGGLHNKIKQSDLISYFSKFGRVKEAVIKLRNYNKKKKSKQSKKNITLGYGYLVVSNSAYEKIMSNGGVHYILGQKIDCQPYVSGEALRDLQSKKLRRRVDLDELPRGISDDELLSIFQKFGRIFKAFARKDLVSKLPNGKGVVIFEEQEGALKALKAANKLRVRGKEIKVRNYLLEMEIKMENEGRQNVAEVYSQNWLEQKYRRQREEDQGVKNLMSGEWLPIKRKPSYNQATLKDAPGSCQQDRQFESRCNHQVGDILNLSSYNQRIDIGMFDKRAKPTNVVLRNWGFTQYDRRSHYISPLNKKYEFAIIEINHSRGNLKLNNLQPN
jgi:RNA recognition motif-containing protein